MRSGRGGGEGGVGGGVWGVGGGVFFFNDTATTEIYTLSLHDALPICAIQKLCVLMTKQLYVVARDCFVQRNEKAQLNILHHVLRWI